MQLPPTLVSQKSSPNVSRNWERILLLKYIHLISLTRCEFLEPLSMRHCQILRNKRIMEEEKPALRLKALTGKIKTIKSEVLHGGYCD